MFKFITQLFCKHRDARVHWSVTSWNVPYYCNDCGKVFKGK